MAAFCKFCGQPLVEGRCSCEEFLADEARSMAARQVPPVAGGVSSGGVNISKQPESAPKAQPQSPSEAGSGQVQGQEYGHYSQAPMQGQQYFGGSSANGGGNFNNRPGSDNSYAQGGNPSYNAGAQGGPNSFNNPNNYGGFNQNVPPGAGGGPSIAGSVFNEMLSHFGKFIKSPVTAIEQMAAEGNRLSQCMWLAFYAVLMFLLILIRFIAQSTSVAGMGAQIGIMIAVFIGLYEAGFALLVKILSKNRDVKFVQVFGTVSVTMIPNIIFTLIIFIVSFIGSDLSAAIMWLVMSVMSVYGLTISKEVSDHFLAESKDGRFWKFMLIQVLLYVIFGLLAYVCAQSYLSYLLRGAFGGYSYFG